MFANARPSQGTNTGFLLEFKAGRSNLTAGSSAEKRKIVADKTKGLVFIKQSSDQLMHFCWKNRQTGAVVDDLIIFPGDTEFMKVKECPDGKVYMLKFKSSAERRLFWIQDGNPDADKDLCQKVNDLLNKPPNARSSTRGGSESRAAAGLGASSGALGALGSGGEELGALGGLDQNQLMQLLSLMNNGQGNESGVAASVSGEGSSTPAAENAPAALSESGGKVTSTQRSQLQSLLSALKPSTSHTKVDMSDVLKGEKVVDVVRKNKERFSDHVIDVSDSSITNKDTEIEQTVRQPQYQQAVAVFGYAYLTGQLAPVLEQFGFSEAALKAAVKGDVLELAKSLTESESSPVKKESSPEITEMAPVPTSSPEGTNEEPREPAPKKGKTEDDEMDLD